MNCPKCPGTLVVHARPQSGPTVYRCPQCHWLSVEHALGMVPFAFAGPDEDRDGDVLDPNGVTISPGLARPMLLEPVGMDWDGSYQSLPLLSHEPKSWRDRPPLL
jgi:hypothetical protein